jgi:hypothetical protein
VTATLGLRPVLGKMRGGDHDNRKEGGEERQARNETRGGRWRRTAFCIASAELPVIAAKQEVQ